MKTSVYICYSITASQGPAISSCSLSLSCLCPLPVGRGGDSLCASSLVWSPWDWLGWKCVCLFPSVSLAHTPSDTRQELWMDVCVRIELIWDPWGLGVPWPVLRNDSICHTVADKSTSCVRFRGSAQQACGPDSAFPFSVFFGCFHAELRHFHRDPVTHKVPDIYWLARKGTKLVRPCPAQFVALIKELHKEFA